MILALCLGIAGALGAVARYGLAEWMARHWQRPFPLATFLINSSGAFALGFLYTVGVAQVHTPTLATWRVVLGTGFLGGYTTFSTLSFETLALARRGEHFFALLNALGSLVISVLAVVAGVALGNIL